MLDRLSVVFTTLVGAAWLCASPVQAATVYDGDAGFFADDLNTSPAFGTASNLSSIGGTLQAAAGQSGSFTTNEIMVPSSYGWKKVHFKHSMSAGATLALSVKDLDTNVTQSLTWVASSEPGYTGEATIPFGPGTQRLALTFTLNGASAATPVILDQYRLTWTPKAVLAASLSASTSVASGASVLQTLYLSNSFVEARDVVALVPLAAGAKTPSFGQVSQLVGQAINAPGGAQTGWGPATLPNGQAVPANTAWIYYPSVAAGKTFIITVTSQVPNGTLNGTSYANTAQISAQKITTSGTTLSADPVSVTTSPTIAYSSPNLELRKTIVGGAYQIGSTLYANADTDVTYQITVTNRWAPQSAAHAYNLVVADDFKAIKGTNSNATAYPTNPSAITAGFGVGNGTNPYAGQPSLNPVLPVTNEHYWKIDKLAVGESKTFTFTVRLNTAGPLFDGSNGAKDTVTNPAWVESAFSEQAGRLDASASLKVGVIYDPIGIYAKGDWIAGSASVSAGNDDNVTRTVTYGSNARWLLAVRNGGFSVLTQTLLVDKLSDLLDFNYASLPLGPDNKPVGKILYYYKSGDPDPYGAAFPRGFPPELTEAGYDPATTAATALLGSSWSTTLPPNPAQVRWVAFYIPAVTPYFTSSPAISLSGIPGMDGTISAAPANSVTAELAFTVRPPAAACTTASATNLGLFKTYGYKTPSLHGATGAGDAGGNWGVGDSEQMTITPVLPAFENSAMWASPNVVLGANTTTFTFQFTNNDVGAAATDPANDVVATITIPTVVANGVSVKLPIVSVNAGPDGIATITPAGDVTVTYPPTPGSVLPPGASRSIQVQVQVPKGVANGTSFTAQGRVTAEDDVCGPIQGLASASASVTVTPYLSIAKLATHEYANKGADLSDLQYVLSHINLGEASTRGVTIVDRLPTWAILDSTGSDYHVKVDLGARVFFSENPNFGIPETDITESFVLNPANFLLGTESPAGSGKWFAPGAGNWRYVAVLPDQLIGGSYVYPTSVDGVPRKVYVNVEIAAGAPDTAVLYNDTEIRSAELLAATSNVVKTAVSGDPSLVVDKLCLPEVAANGEAFTLTTTWRNASTNPDYNVELTETLPAGTNLLRVGYTLPNGTVQPLTAYGSVPGNFAITGTSTSGWTVRWLLGQQLGATPFASLQEATLVVEVSLSGASTGTWFNFASQGVANNQTNPQGIVAGTSCNILAANPDLWVRKLVDIANPVPGEVVTFRLEVSNQGPHAADNVVISDTLPAIFTYVPGSTQVLTSGWRLGGAGVGDDDPVFAGGNYVWSLAQNNAVTATASGATAGRIPGGQTVVLTYRATLGASAQPGTGYDNCVAVTNTWTEDPNTYTNSACVTVTPPLPDPQMVKTGTAEALSGDTVSYQLAFSNNSRMQAQGVYFIESLPDSSRLPAADPRKDDADTAGPDVTFRAVSLPSGTPPLEVYYHAAAGAAPTFSYATPTAGGWSASPTSPVSHMAFRLTGIMPGYAPTRTVNLEVELRKPDDSLPVAGTTFVNCATIRTSDAQQSTDFPNPGADTNDTSCADTQIPGVDLKLTKLCGAPCAVNAVKGRQGGAADDVTCVDPTVRVQPGDPARFVLRVANSGTEIVRGVKLTDALPAGLTYVADSSATVTVTDRFGAASSPVDAAGARINDATWTRSGLTWYLGNQTNNTDPRSYLNVGLAAGDVAYIAVDVTIDRAVLDDELIDNTAVVVSDNPGPKPEENTTNNTSACTLKVDRPNVFVRKSVVLANGSSGPAHKGDLVTYTVEYGIEGGVPAYDTTLTDYLPEGIDFIQGSFTPASVGGANTVYQGNLDPAGGLMCPPDCSPYYVSPDATQPDPDLRGLTLNWSPMPSPLEGAFFDGRDPFTGTTSGTTINPDSTVTADLGATSPSYTTESIGAAAEWYQVLINSGVLHNDPRAADANASAGAPSVAADFLVDILDAATDAVIPGYEDLPVSSNGGSIDIEGVAASDIKVKVKFPENLGDGGLVAASGPAVTLGGPLNIQNGEAWAVATSGDATRVFGMMLAQDQNSAFNTSPYNAPAVWQCVGGTCNLEALLPDVGVFSYEHVKEMRAISYDELWVRFESPGYAEEIVVYRWAGDGWASENLERLYGGVFVDPDVATCAGVGCTISPSGAQGLTVVNVPPEPMPHVLVYGAANPIVLPATATDATPDALLGDVLFDSCSALDINANGTVLGWCYAPGLNYSLVVWAWDGAAYSGRIISGAASADPNPPPVGLDDRDVVIYQDLQYNTGVLSLYPVVAGAPLGAAGWTSSVLSPGTLDELHPNDRDHGCYAARQQNGDTSTQAGAWVADDSALGKFRFETINVAAGTYLVPDMGPDCELAVSQPTAGDLGTRVTGIFRLNASGDYELAHSDWDLTPSDLYTDATSLDFLPAGALSGEMSGDPPLPGAPGIPGAGSASDGWRVAWSPKGYAPDAYATGATRSYLGSGSQSQTLLHDGNNVLLAGATAIYDNEVLTTYPVVWTATADATSPTYLPAAFSGGGGAATGAIMSGDGQGTLLGMANGKAMMWTSQTDGTWTATEVTTGCESYPGLRPVFYRAFASGAIFGECWSDVDGYGWAPYVFTLSGGVVVGTELSTPEVWDWMDGSPNQQNSDLSDFNALWDSAGGTGIDTFVMLQWIESTANPGTFLRLDLPQDWYGHANYYDADKNMLRAGDALVFEHSDGINEVVSVAVPTPGNGTNGDFSLIRLPAPSENPDNPTLDASLYAMDESYAVVGVVTWSTTVVWLPEFDGGVLVGYQDPMPLLDCDPFGVPFFTPDPVGWPAGTGINVFCPTTVSGDPALYRFDGVEFDHHTIPSGTYQYNQFDSREGYGAGYLAGRLYEPDLQVYTVGLVGSDGMNASTTFFNWSGGSLVYLGMLEPGRLIAMGPESSFASHLVVVDVDTGEVTDVTPPGYSLGSGYVNNPYSEGYQFNVEADPFGRFLVPLTPDDEGALTIFAFQPDGAGGYLAIDTGMIGKAPRHVGGGCWTVDYDNNYPYWKHLTLSQGVTPRVWGCTASASGGGGGTSAVLTDITVSYSSGEPQTLTYQGVVQDFCAARITNDVSIATTSTETTTADNNASASIDLVQSDIEVTVTRDYAVVGGLAQAPNNVITYTVTAKNLGPYPARSVTVGFTGETDASLVTYAGTTTMTWTDLAVNATQTFQVVGTVQTNTAGTVLTAGAQVTNNSEIDCNEVNDTSSTLSVVGEYPNVWVEKSAPQYVNAGDQLTYTLTYGNNGNASASATLSDTLPAGVTFVSASRAGDASFNPSGTAPLFSNRTLAPGATETIAIVVDTSSDCATVGDVLRNVVTISAPNDIDTADNQDAAETTVLAPNAAMEAYLVQSESLLQPGQTLTYTGYFSSTGSDAVINPVVVITLGSNVTVIPESITAGGQVVGDTIVWDASALGATLEPGAVGSVTVAVEVGQTGPFLASIEATGDNICPYDPLVSADVEPLAGGLQVVKSADTNAACVDGTVAWTILVTNTGLTTINSVQVADSVPAAYVPSSIYGVGAVDSGAPNLLWNVGALAPGAGTTLGYSTLAPAVGETLVNTARATAANGVTVTSNEAAIAVDCNAVLSLSKTWTAGCLVPGGTVDVTLTYTNEGSGVLTGVLVEDYISAEFSDVTDLGGGASFNATTRMLTAAVGDLLPGESGTVTFTLTLSDALPGGEVVLNRGQVSADGVAPMASNQVASLVIDCDDGDPCTIDTCNTSGACQHLPIDVGGACDDGDACTTGEVCMDGACGGGTTLSCDDGEACTDDSCDPAVGCVNAADDTNTCADSDLCTNDACVAGACVSTAIDCNDGASCTTESCNPTSGACDFVYDDAGCALQGAGACSVGVCDPTLQGADPVTGCAVTSQPDGYVVTAGVPCGEGACGAFTGDIVCQGGVEASTCDPSYQLVSDLGDTSCAPDAPNLEVAYILVQNSSGDPVGTLRCFRNVATGVVECDEETAGSGVLKVYEGLACPGVTP